MLECLVMIVGGALLLAMFVAPFVNAKKAHEAKNPQIIPFDEPGNKPTTLPE